MSLATNESTKGKQAKERRMSKDMDEGAIVGIKEQTYGQFCKCIN